MEWKRRELMTIPCTVESFHWNGLHCYPIVCRLESVHDVEKRKAQIRRQETRAGQWQTGKLRRWECGRNWALSCPYVIQLMGESPRQKKRERERKRGEIVYTGSSWYGAYTGTVQSCRFLTTVLPCIACLLVEGLNLRPITTVLHIWIICLCCELKITKGSVKYGFHQIWRQ